MNANLLITVMEAALERQITSRLWKCPTQMGAEGQEVRLIVALEVWELRR
jgi:hypothetical protein